MSRIMKVVAGSVLLLSVGQWALAQTPAQMEYERQQREYRQQLEQQRQDQQRLQQLQNENARRQQEETNRNIRANTPSNSIPSMPSGGGPTTSGAGSSSSGARVPQETRQMWEKQAALAHDRNPLIGRWARPAADQSTLAGAIMSMVGAGACGLFFGTEDGFVEFRPTTLVAVDRSGREQVLAEVAYRGRAKRVAVLPKVSPQALIDLFVFDVDSADRITLSSFDCKMVRVGAVAAQASSSQASSASSLGASAPQTPGALAVAAGFAAPGGAFQPLVGGAFFVLKESADVVLAKGGVRAAPNASPLKTWAIACGTEQPACGQGMMQIVKNSVGVMKTNSAGKAQLVGLPSGTYYLFGANMLNAQPLIWNVKTDLRSGTGSVTLDQRNAVSMK